jgi:CBS domain-containing protein
MKVGDIIQRAPVTIPAGTSMLDAAKLMVENNIGLLVVSHPSDKTKFAGVVSERDIMKALASGRQVTSPIEQVTTKQVVTVKASSDVAEAAKAMNQHRIRHVVVVNDHEKLVGVVSMRDLVGERATLTAILRSYEKEVFIGGD